MSAPRLLLCAPASGGGKTTVTCALLQALVNRGAGPVAFKCGPDYIDPMFHSEIIGAKSRNLDLFFLGRDTARYLLEKNSRGSGLALIEGVMGYYDGIGLSADASAYDLARATGTPAVLVLDGRGRALTAAAAVKGMRDFRPDSGIRGVVLNRVEHPSFPDTITGVIYQSGAFSCLTDGQFNQPVAESAYRAAQDALNGWDPSGGAIYYYNPKTATNKWIRSRPVISTIGRHVFCS